MNPTFAYYSGKIEVRKEGCFVGEQKIDCPQEDQTLLRRPFMQSGLVAPGTSRLDLLPPNPAWDVRNDVVFLPLFFLVVLGLLALYVTKVKIFGQTLADYLRPIWYFILVALAAVFWQYLVGVTLEGSSPWLKLSQLVWEIVVAASVYKMVKTPDAGYGRLFCLGVLYSLFIHGLKVSIRYFFYAQTLWYVADRFLYGILLVMLITAGGGLLLFSKRMGLLRS